ncbi:MAG: hypothetical protein KC589_01665 [Nanoarchaeota archaeon]|jgi:DNA-binding XRE family transcriptional regulator|nr:hypothetical protein [Nanoarchaeota archaeon]
MHNELLNYFKGDEIRNLYSSGDYLQKDLGIKIGINQQQISKIINYKQWK